MMKKPIFSAFSHTGYVRSNNEDEYLYLESSDGLYTLLIIADGMGGHQCGEEASKIAVQQFSRIIEERLHPNISEKEILDIMDYAAETANIHVELESSSSPEKEGMGTTLTAAILIGRRFFIAHVGDSRIYQLQNGRMKKLTKDDTYVQYLLDTGKIRKGEESSHPQKSVLLKALGVKDQIEAQLSRVTVKQYDKILFCTDGLYDVVKEEEIKIILQEAKNPEAAVDRLIRLTLERGAPDNVSVLVGFL